jgi:hypothetical protein
MVRITTEEQKERVVWRIEGSFRGPWVAELEKLWQSARDCGKHLCLSLEDVPYIDDAARDLITRMYRQGVEISAKGLYVTGIVQEIQSGCSPPRSVPEFAG